MLLHTQRLILRDYIPSDADDLHEIFSDPVVMKDCEPPYLPEQTKAILSSFIKNRTACAAILPESGKLIGHLLFHQLPTEEAGIYEIGWFFNRKYWHQGYAFEACMSLMEYGFHDLKLHKICAETIDPVRSVALMKKLGMCHEGTFRSHARTPDGRWTDVFWYAICNPEEESLYESSDN